MRSAAERQWPGDLGYALLLAVVALPWIANATHSTSGGYGFLAGPHPSDARLIVSILANVTRGLVEDPARLFDIPVSHPVPNQLAGSEHFLSSQLIFAPLRLLGANALLAANATALLSYLIAAIVMRRYLTALGCGTGTAWVAGLLFSLGPFRTPGNLQVLQYPNLFLPLVLLGLLRLRERPGAATAGRLSIIFALALFSSYYMAALAGIAGAVGALIEYRGSERNRRAFVVWGLTASMPPIIALALFSRPYLEYVAGSASDSGSSSRLIQGWIVLSSPIDVLVGAIGIVGILLTLVGLLAGFTGGGGARPSVATRGLVFSLLGLLLTTGGMTPLSDTISLLLPFFRSPVRFLVLAGLGTALLAAAGLDALGARMPRATRWVPIATTLAILIEYGPGFAARLDPFSPLGKNRGVYESVARITRERGAGPLAEFPVGGLLTADAMIGATLHGMPLINGYTGYPDPGARQVANAVAKLRTRDGISDLAAMTGLRWILLRPVLDDEGLRPFDEFLDRVDSSAVVQTWELGASRLIEIASPEKASPWREALGRGIRPGETALGTALTPLPPSQSAAAIHLIGPLPSPGAGKRIRLSLLVHNRGTTAWPAAETGQADSAARVRLRIAWQPIGRIEGDGQTEIRKALPVDFAPGASRIVDIPLLVPGEPGSYRLRISASQGGGEEFSGEGHEPLDALIVVR